MKRPSELEINELMHELVKAAEHIGELTRTTTPFETCNELLNAGRRADQAAQLIAGHLLDLGLPSHQCRYCDHCGQHNYLP